MSWVNGKRIDDFAEAKKESTMAEGGAVMRKKYTPKYGYEMIEWEDAINLGFMYAIRTLDPLTAEINEGSSTLAYCATREQAEIIVRAVNFIQSTGPTPKEKKS